MKYQKAKAEVVRFQETVFMAASGVWDEGCKNYRHDGSLCRDVRPVLSIIGFFCYGYTDSNGKYYDEHTFYCTGYAPLW